MKPSARIVLLAVAASLALCSHASAATPFTVGAGGSPNLAVAANGTAHVVWHNSDTKKINYCRIEPGTTACGAPQVFDNGDPTSVGPPQVLIAPDGKVIVATGDSLGAGGDNRMQVRVSADNGATFSAPVQTGTNLADNAILSADGTRIMSGSTTNSGGFLVTYQSAPLSGSVSNAFAGLLNGSGSWFDPDLALGPASEGSPLVVTYSGSGADGGGTARSGVLFNRYLGGDDNTTASWSNAARVADGSDSRLAGGAGGILVMYKSSVDAGLNYVLSRYNASTFGWSAPVILSAADVSIADNDISQSPNGTFHAVYRRQPGNETEVVRYMRPGFVNPGTVAVDTNVVKTRVAANDAGQGYAVWATSLNDNRTVRAAKLDLIPGSGGPAANQPPTTGPTGPTGPGTTPGPIQTGPTKKGDVDTFGKNGAYQGALIVPKACIRAPNRFRASATFRQIKTVRDRKLPARGQFKTVRVLFRLDFKQAFTDKKPPYARIFSTVGFRSKSTHTVTAKIYLRQRLYKRVKGKRKLVTAKKLNVRTLSAKIKIC